MRTREEWAHAIRGGLACLRAVWLHGGGTLRGDLEAAAWPSPHRLRVPQNCRALGWQAPFRREAVVDSAGCLPELLLDLRPAGDAWYVRVRLAGVLRDFAEGVLPVDQGRPAIPQILKLKTEALEVLVGGIAHPRDDLGWAQAGGVGEAFGHAVERSGWPACAVIQARVTAAGRFSDLPLQCAACCRMGRPPP